MCMWEGEVSEERRDQLDTNIMSKILTFPFAGTHHSNGITHLQTQHPWVKQFQHNPLQPGYQTLQHRGVFACLCISLSQNE